MMRKLIYEINITIDGCAGHTTVIADNELHDFFTNLLDETGTVLFGRKTYELMVDFWPNAKNDPQSTESMIKFADKYNSINKIVFSGSLDKAHWNNTILNKGNAVEEVRKLKQQPGKSLSIGGISLASSLMKAGLIDEFWFLVHPIVSGKGRKLFSQSDGSPEGLNERTDLKLIESIIFKSGVVAINYKKD